MGYASNAFGTINDVPRIIAAAKKAGALTFVDAVHFAPHRAIDVQLLDCDFLACSPYKFYGPHSGVLYGKREALERLRPYKVRPALDAIPDCFETGTKNHEGIAGVAAAVDFLAWLGERCGRPRIPGSRPHTPAGAPGSSRRWRRSRRTRPRLFSRLLAGLLAIPGLRVYGITDPARFAWRTPTACFTIAGPGARPRSRRCWDKPASRSGTATTMPGSP